MSRVVIVDPQFAGEPDVERAVAPPGMDLVVVRPGDRTVDAAMVAGADAVVNCRSRHRIDAALAAAMKGVRLVVQSGVGFNHIDLDACAANGIPVCNVPDYGTMEVADHAIALMLALVRGIDAYQERLRTRDDAYVTHMLTVPPMRRLRGQVFGIVGLGRIGLATAVRARALALDVAFHDPFLPTGAELSLGLRRTRTLSDLLAASDILSIHCPLTPATRNLIDARAVAAMKPGIILVNTARGGIVDLDAVEAGLRDGRICAAGLDVLPVEPIDLGHPLLAAWKAREPWLEGRLVVTPHAAFYTPESLRDMRAFAMQAAVDFLERGELRSCVNLRQLHAHGFYTDLHAGGLPA